jgi:hypothetical protein
MPSEEQTPIPAPRNENMQNRAGFLAGPDGMLQNLQITERDRIADSAIFMNRAEKST